MLICITATSTTGSAKIEAVHAGEQSDPGTAAEPGGGGAGAPGGPVAAQRRAAGH